MLWHAEKEGKLITPRRVTNRHRIALADSSGTGAAIFSTDASSCLLRTRAGSFDNEYTETRQQVSVSPEVLLVLQVLLLAATTLRKHRARNSVTYATIGDKGSRKLSGRC